MAYRISVQDRAEPLRIVFEGVLDSAALAEITALARGARARHGRKELWLVLESGTEVDPECIEPLRRIEGVEVRPVSAFLARWLAAR